MRMTIVAACASLLIAPAFAAKVTEKDVTVTRIMTDSNFFGGCMAKLSPNPKSLLPECNDDWISFSCTGEFMPKDMAGKLYSSAQLALVTGQLSRSG